jgi:hypothetical protein
MKNVNEKTFLILTKYLFENKKDILTGKEKNKPVSIKESNTLFHFYFEIIKTVNNKDYLNYTSFSYNKNDIINLMAKDLKII